MVIAIDSAQKRYSALKDNQVYMPGLYPDTDIDQGDRQSISFAYSGVLADAPAAITARGHYMNDVVLIWKLRRD